jgi:hypothetical protein
MTVTDETIVNNFRTAYPNESILIYKYRAPGGTGIFHGVKLLEVKLHNEEWLTIYKLKKSSGTYMNSDDIKFKAFPFICDTQSETDPNKRRDKLKTSLKNVFPNHHVNVFIFCKNWTGSSYSCGATSFRGEYGSDVDIVLS